MELPQVYVIGLKIDTNFSFSFSEVCIKPTLERTLLKETLSKLKKSIWFRIMVKADLKNEAQFPSSAKAPPSLIIILKYYIEGSFFVVRWTSSIRMWSFL